MLRSEKKIAEDGGENGEYVDNHATTQDAVFGELTEEGPNYRAVRSHSIHLSLSEQFINPA